MNENKIAKIECGSNSMVEYLISNQNVAGSSPVCRTMLESPALISAIKSVERHCEHMSSENDFMRDLSGSQLINQADKI